MAKAFNQLHPKPDFVHHRVVRDPAGGAVTADPAVSAFTAEQLAAWIRGCIDCRGYETIEGFVLLSGGTNPKVDLEPTESARYRGDDGTGDPEQRVLIAGSKITALSTDDKFSLTVNGGRFRLRIDALTGSPTKVEILLAGGHTRKFALDGRR